MNKTTLLIGRVFSTTAHLIKWSCTIEVIIVTTAMPLVLLAILYTGKIPQTLVESQTVVDAMKNYSFYLSISIFSWFMWAVQKYVVKKTYIYKRNKQ